MKPPEMRIDRSTTKALRLFDADRFRWLDEASALGPIVALRFGLLTTWVVTDSDVARTMLQTEADSWKRPPVTLVPARIAVGENLFTQREKAWAKLQPLLGPSFRKRALESRLTDIDAVVADELRGSRTTSRSISSSQPRADRIAARSVGVAGRAPRAGTRRRDRDERTRSHEVGRARAWARSPAACRSRSGAAPRP